MRGRVGVGYIFPEGLPVYSLKQYLLSLFVMHGAYSLVSKTQEKKQILKNHTHTHTQVNNFQTTTPGIGGSSRENIIIPQKVINSAVCQKNLGVIAGSRINVHFHHLSRRESAGKGSKFKPTLFLSLPLSLCC